MIFDYYKQNRAKRLQQLQSTGAPPVGFTEINYFSFLGDKACPVIHSNTSFLRSLALIDFSSVSTEQIWCVVPPRAAPHSDPGGGASVPWPQEASVAPDGARGQAGDAAQRSHGSHRQRRSVSHHQHLIGEQRNHVRYQPKKYSSRLLWTGGEFESIHRSRLDKGVFTGDNSYIPEQTSPN